MRLSAACAYDRYFDETCTAILAGFPPRIRVGLLFSASLVPLCRLICLMLVSALAAGHLLSAAGLQGSGRICCRHVAIPGDGCCARANAVNPRVEMGALRCDLAGLGRGCCCRREVDQCAAVSGGCRCCCCIMQTPPALPTGGREAHVHRGDEASLESCNASGLQHGLAAPLRSPADRPDPHAVPCSSRCAIFCRWQC